MYRSILLSLALAASVSAGFSPVSCASTALTGAVCPSRFYFYNGQYYRVSCGKLSTPGGNALSSVQQPSEAECYRSCNANSNCRAAVWITLPFQTIGQCSLYASVSVSTTDSTTNIAEKLDTTPDCNAATTTTTTTTTAETTTTTTTAETTTTTTTAETTTTTAETTTTTTTAETTTTTDGSTTTTSVTSTTSTTTTSQGPVPTVCGVGGFSKDVNAFLHSADGNFKDCKAYCLKNTECKSFQFSSKECYLYNVPAYGNVIEGPSGEYVFYDVTCPEPSVTTTTSASTSTSTTSGVTTTTSTSTTSTTLTTTTSTTTTSTTTTSTTTTKVGPSTSTTTTKSGSYTKDPSKPTSKSSKPYDPSHPSGYTTGWESVDVSKTTTTTKAPIHCSYTTEIATKKCDRRGCWPYTITSTLYAETCTWDHWQPKPTKPADPWANIPKDEWKDRVTVTVITTKYVSVCATGYTTVPYTTTVTLTKEKAEPTYAYPTEADGCPSGFYKTTTVCAYGCGKPWATVTVTLPYEDKEAKPAEPTDFWYKFTKTEVDAEYKTWETYVVKTPVADASASWEAVKTPVADASASWSAVEVKPTATDVNAVKVWKGAASTVQIENMFVVLGAVVAGFFML